MHFLLPILLALAAGPVRAEAEAEAEANNADIATVLFTDVKSNLNEYISLVQNNPSFSFPTALIGYFTEITTYTDDSYTSLLTDFPASQVLEVATKLPWYSSRLESKLSVAATAHLDDVSSSAEAPVTSAASSDHSKASSAASSVEKSLSSVLTSVIAELESMSSEFASESSSASSEPSSKASSSSAESSSGSSSASSSSTSSSSSSKGGDIKLAASASLPLLGLAGLLLL